MDYMLRHTRKAASFTNDQQQKQHLKCLSYLGYAGWAVPVSLRDTGDLGFMTVSVAAFVTAITQQEEILVIPLSAHLTVLQKGHLFT